MTAIKNCGVNGTRRDRAAKVLIWACFFMLLMVHGSKNAYVAEVVALQDVFSKGKAEISLAMTYYFVTYAITQIVLSVLIGKVNLKIFLSIAIGISSILTVLIGFAPSLTLIYVLCSVNGVLQAGAYSGTMAVISKYAPSHLIPFANGLMSSATALYGFISYGVTALFVGMGRWDLPFIILGSILFVSVVFFFYAVHRMRAYPTVAVMDKEVTVVEQSLVKLPTKNAKTIFLAIMMFVALLGNTIHYAIMGWVPDMLYAIYDMPQEYSILITLLLPLAMFIGSLVAIRVCERKKDLFAVGIVFAVGVMIMMLPITFLYDVSMVLFLAIIIIMFVIAQGQRLIYGSILSFRVSTEINVGSYLAATNALASIAAGVAPTIAGSIIDAGEGISGYGTLFIFALALTFVLFAITVFIWLFYKKKSANK